MGAIRGFDGGQGGLLAKDRPESVSRTLGLEKAGAQGAEVLIVSRDLLIIASDGGRIGSPAG